MRVIFMGTPEFACPSLEAIINDPDLEIAAIYTKEPKISGRGHKIQNSPIHKLALKHNLPIFTPKTLKDQESQTQFKNLKADLAIVVAFGLILPDQILNATKHGCLNIHPSILPKWRGAAPMQRAIMNGDDQTGIAIIKMNSKLDSGDILHQETMPLDNKTTYQDLEQTMSQKGAKLITKISKDFCQGKITPTPQDDHQASYAKKISKDEAKINFSQPAQKVIRQINALSGNIGAYLEYKGEKIKILKAKIVDQSTACKNVGQVVSDQFYIECQTGVIQPQILQRSGRGIIKIDDFLLGFRFQDQS